ncbi:hypothetical protein HOY80DRAFT_1110619 [Tuber brumale]|nr:hypothetical protein HOY80DRAFT_1110619 [Tuber brumale]
MTTTRGIFIGLILFFALLPLTHSVPTAAPDVAEITPDMLRTTPIDIANLPVNYNANIAPGDPKVQTWVHCETSMSPPRLFGARITVGYLYASRDNNCSRLVHYGNADIAICGQEHGRFKCRYVAFLRIFLPTTAPGGIELVGRTMCIGVLGLLSIKVLRAGEYSMTM